MVNLKRNVKNKEIPGKGEWNTFIIAISALALAFIVLMASTIFATQRDSPPAPASSSGYTGQITILNKTESLERCAFMYTRDEDPSGGKWVNESEPLCEMASIGPVYMEDGYLDYKSLVKSLEAQG